MTFRYRVKDDDGDMSIIEFNFDFNKGRLIMEAEPKQLFAVKGYQFPTDEDVERSFKSFVESGDLGLDDDESIQKRTLLVMLEAGWCDSAKKIHEAEGVFEIALKTVYSVSALRALAKSEGEDLSEHDFPKIRTEAASFLWDSFVYIHEQGIAVSADPEKKREIENAIREETGHDDFELADAMPKAIGCWALPVKIYDDQDLVVTRVPYDVMEDLYAEWKKRGAESLFSFGDSSLTFDGSALGDSLPVNITNEINELFNKFNKKHE